MSSSVQQVVDHHAPLAESNPSRVAQIDRTLRSPVALLAASSVVWLAIGSVLALVAALKLHLPEFLNTEVLTYGRVRALQSNALVYGWAFNAILAVSLWMMHRLGRVELRQGWVAVLGALAWNATLTYGLLALAAGQSTGVEWLEMPREVGPVLTAAFLLVALWSVVAFSRRQTPHVYVSQWYLLAALFCLPVVHVIAQLTLLWLPARGTVQAVASGWYSQGVSALFLVPAGLAAVYYLLPKVLGRPVRGYYLAVVGFWTFILFAGWAGASGLVGGPIPVWLQSVSVVASVMMLIPILVTAINFHGTVAGSWADLRRSPVLSFVVFGAVNFTVAGLVASVVSFREVSAVVRLTDFTLGQGQQLQHAFLAMVLFGALYYILPRLARREWPSASLIRTHFWLCALGTVGLVAVLLAHGWIQGGQWNAAKLTPAEVAVSALPWNVAASSCAMLLALGHLVFCGHVLWLLASGASRRDDSNLSAR